ncbi:hypothetical protein [uncultured Aliiroseovarius sp.]|uniref:hypothetical protein n=1 Tax=uncultured Aliiroseovarius sp. TaxID=1658783 RepID=UPI0026058535|nr:hypothetical protein [uncultured Aliiroseovarius sp.]
MQRIRSGARHNTVTESKRITDTLQAKFHIGKGQDGLLIRNGSEAVDRIYAGTRWANGAWNRALGQLSGAFKLEHPERFPNIPGKHRCLGIPLHYLPELDDEDDGDGDVSF